MPLQSPMNNLIAYTAHAIYTGSNMLQNHAILVNGNTIEKIMPLVSLPKDIEVKDFGNATIAPPFIDLQLYGAGGRLLSEFPDTDTLHAIAAHNRATGTAYCLPTVATAPYEVIFQCIDAVRAYWQQNGKGILGLHIEGPWINPVKRGAHIESLIFAPTPDQVKQLLEYGKEVIRIITLAPEICSHEVVSLIRSYNVEVSAGHSNATYEQATASFSPGNIELVTHLYNAMSGLQHRSPGLVGATLDHDIVKASIIPDGHHVDFSAVRIAKKIMGERLFVITDAVTETTTGNYPHHLEEDKYVANDILSGSALTMSKAVYNLVHQVHVPLSEALRMCSLYPARVLNLVKDKFLLKEGYAAEMVVLNEQLEVVFLLC